MSDTPDIYSLFTPTAKAYFADIGSAVGKAYNFYNPQDGAVGQRVGWPANQALKPDSEPAADFNYGWDAVIGKFYENRTVRDESGVPIGVVRTDLNLGFLPDAWTAFSFAPEAKSIGLGAAADVFGPFAQAGQVNLESDFPVGERFTDSRDDHSGQFIADNMRRNKYWNVLMKRFGLTPWSDSTPSLGQRP